MTPRTAKPYHHGDLRRALLDAAEDLLSEEGADRLSLRSIARRAGVSHAAPYHHFADLDGLLSAVASGGFVQLRERMLRVDGPDDTSALENLQKAGIAYVRFAAENPELYRLMFSGRLRQSNNAELAETSNRAYAALGELLNRIGSRPQKATQEKSEAIANTAWATVHGLAMLIIDDRLDVDRNDPNAVEEAARTVTVVLGRGLRA